nr:sulfurtransferase TusA family protein [Methylobrevis pamukkalensis]
MDAEAGHATLDARGLNCPLPVLKARKALAGLVPGARLVVVASDPMAVIDIPHLCTSEGHRLVASQVAGRLSAYLVEKGPTLSTPSGQET